MPFYLARVRLLIEAESADEAADTCGEVLREQCEDFAPGSALITWAHERAVQPAAFDREANPAGASYDAEI